MKTKKGAKKGGAVPCLVCGGPLAASRENHRYTISGDWAVTIEGVEMLSCRKCGERSVVLENVEKLRRTIAAALTRKRAGLAVPEIVFLRSYLGYKASELAATLGVTPTSLSRWENGKQPIDPTADRLLRALVVIRDHGEETFNTGVLASIAEDGTPMRLTIRMGTDGEWKAAA